MNSVWRRGGSYIPPRHSSTTYYKNKAAENEYQQHERNGLNPYFVPHRSSTLVPMVSSLMHGINIGMPDLKWSGTEKHWQCRLLNGPCAGLLIDATGVYPEYLELKLFPPDRNIREKLVRTLPEIEKAMAVYGEVNVKVIDAEQE